MTKLFASLILLSLTVACNNGFEKQKPKKTTRPEVRQETDSFSINQDYIQLVNEVRINKGLTPMSYLTIIEDIARGHSKGMALHTRPFGHMGFTARCRWLRNRMGRHRQCAELVAMGQKNIKAVFRAWMKEPKHREEIERPGFTHTGLGLFKDERGVVYWTQMFIEL